MDYYNENDPYAAQWLKNLSTAGLIPKGKVDERDIRKIRATELAGFRQAHFFAGIGGWPEALRLAGWPEDLPVWTGSCPCQPFSAAGKRRGTADERHLWPIWRELIRKCRPSAIFGEQVASKDGRSWLYGVRSDLEKMGYAVGAADLCVAGISAPHIRQRLWWVAHALGAGREGEGEGRLGRLEAGRGLLPAGDCFSTLRLGDPKSERRVESLGHEYPPEGIRKSGRQSPPANNWDKFTLIECGDGKTRKLEPGTSPLAHGVQERVAKLRAYGNAIVPALAAEFIGASMDVLGIQPLKVRS